MTTHSLLLDGRKDLVANCSNQTGNEVEACNSIEVISDGALVEKTLFDRSVKFLTEFEKDHYYQD